MRRNVFPDGCLEYEPLSLARGCDEKIVEKSVKKKRVLTSHRTSVNMLDATQVIACGLYKWKTGKDSSKDTYV